VTTSTTASRNTPVILAEIAVLILLATAFTAAAWKAFPVWDDAWRVLILNVEGGEIYANCKDAPMMAVVRQFLVDHHVFWQVATLLHWLTWIATGLVTMRLWAVLFPDHRRYALPVACFAMAPLLCQTQYIIETVTIGCQVPILIVYAAILLVWPPRRQDRPFWRKAASHAIAVTFIALATLMSEYALPAIAAGVVLMALTPDQSGEAWRARWKTIALFLVTSFVAYLIYWWMADVSMRPDVRPETVMMKYSSVRNIVTMGANFVTSIWQGTFGTQLLKLGEIRCADKIRLPATLLAGLPLACIVSLITLYGAKRSYGSGAEEIYNPRKTFTLLAVLIVGILPVIAMQQAPGVGNGSRFWLPILPVLACLNIYLLMSVLRMRTWWIVAPLCGFLAGYFTATTAASAILDLHKVKSWGKSLEQYVSRDGLTVAIFDNVMMPNNVEYTREYELTARLIASWPNEKQKRFWAFSNPILAMQNTSGIYNKTRSAEDVPQIDRDIRGVVRHGPIERLLWVHGEYDGSLSILNCRDMHGQDSAKGAAPFSTPVLNSIVPP